jgi:hypothetical protein
MKLAPSTFTTLNWDDVEAEDFPGETGGAVWRTVNVGEVRVRRVDYSAGYLADHWCPRGHILLVLDGVLETELKDGRRFTLSAGMSYIVSDDGDAPHRSRTSEGAVVFIVD